MALAIDAGLHFQDVVIRYDIVVVYRKICCRSLLCGIVNKPGSIVFYEFNNFGFIHSKAP